MAAAERFDVAVVGAGPAGAHAARLIAAAGREVVLFDRERHPRYKTCGGGVVGRALREVADVDVGGIPIRAAEMRIADAGLRVRVERPALLRMTMRAELDSALLEAACAAGAQARHPCAVRGLAREDGGWRLETDGGPVRARFVLAADGALGRTAAAAGFPPPVRGAPAIECEIPVPTGGRAAPDGVALFDFGGDVPAGYGWVFPKGGSVSAGVIAMRGPGAGLSGALARYLAGVGLAESEGAARHGFVVPLRPRPGPPARDGVLLLGDAAGLADPLSAEGIGPALLSARAAAEALVEARLVQGRAERLYARRLRGLLADHAIARRLARILYGAPRLRARIFGARGRVLCEAMARVVSGEAGYRELVLSPRGWVRLARSRT